MFHTTKNISVLDQPGLELLTQSDAAATYPAFAVYVFEEFGIKVSAFPN